jgi:hypothetical protein
VFHGVIFRKWHDLGYLLDLCTALNPRWEQFYDQAEFLSPFAAEYRYPDLLVQFTREQADHSLQIARQIRQAVLDELELGSKDNPNSGPEEARDDKRIDRRPDF